MKNKSNNSIFKTLQILVIIIAILFILSNLLGISIFLGFNLLKFTSPLFSCLIFAITIVLLISNVSKKIEVDAENRTMC